MGFTGIWKYVPQREPKPVLRAWGRKATSSLSFPCP